MTSPWETGTWSCPVMRQKVLDLTCEGFTTREVAAELALTFDNVKAHKRLLMCQYKAKNMCQVIYLWMMSRS